MSAARSKREKPIPNLLLFNHFKLMHSNWRPMRAAAILIRIQPVLKLCKWYSPETPSISLRWFEIYIQILFSLHVRTDSHSLTKYTVIHFPRKQNSCPVIFLFKIKKYRHCRKKSASIVDGVILSMSTVHQLYKHQIIKYWCLKSSSSLELTENHLCIRC